MDKKYTKSILVVTITQLAIAATALSSAEEPAQVSTPESAPAEVVAPENQEAVLSEEEQVTADPVEDTDEVEEVKRESSYADPSTDHAVARALFEQGYFSSATADDKENFTNALKNFQTLNGLAPTGEITPEVLSKLGIGQSQFSPE